MFKDLYMLTYRRQAALQTEFIRYSEIYRMIESLKVDPEVDNESIAWFELTEELQRIIGSLVNHADDNVCCDNFKEYIALYLDVSTCKNEEVHRMFASRIYGFISPAGKVYLSSVSLEDVALTILSHDEVPLKPLYTYVQELINRGYGVISSDETYMDDGSGVGMRYSPVYYLSGFQPTTAQKRSADYYGIKFVGSGYVYQCPEGGGDEMKIVEQIFQSPDGKLYAFSKAKDENYKLIAESAGYCTNNIAGPRNTLILNGWAILTSVNDNPGYQVESYASSYEDDKLKYAIESILKRINSEKGYVLRGNSFPHTVRGGEDID